MHLFSSNFTDVAFERPNLNIRKTRNMDSPNFTGKPQIFLLPHRDIRGLIEVFCSSTFQVQPSPRTQSTKNIAPQRNHAALPPRRAKRTPRAEAIAREIRHPPAEKHTRARGGNSRKAHPRSRPRRERESERAYSKSRELCRPRRRVRKFPNSISRVHQARGAWKSSLPPGRREITRLARSPSAGSFIMQNL